MRFRVFRGPAHPGTMSWFGDRGLVRWELGYGTFEVTVTASDALFARAELDGRLAWWHFASADHDVTRVGRDRWRVRATVWPARRAS